MDIVKSRILFSAEVVRKANSNVLLTRIVFCPYFKICGNVPLIKNYAVCNFLRQTNTYS